MHNMSKLVSIVIPCYNHGHFLQEAIDSVEQCDSSLYELIIVNDGSKDAHTIEVLNKLDKLGYRVVHQQNQGLAKTRNNGIKLAQGNYILPLDADNKIRPEYISYSIHYFQNHPDVDVIYSEAEYFGARHGISQLPDFNLQRMMIGNYIDACAVYRKSAWEKVGGYDTNMPYMGVEDWEFWLRLAFTGSKFHHVKEPLFFYRVAENSMISKDTQPNFEVLKSYIEKKHAAFINNEAVVQYMEQKFKANPFVFLFKMVLKTYFPKMYQKLADEKKITRF